MKGISPLVAAVLLIAVTMTIAGMLAYWASGFVRQQVTSFSNQSITSECNFANFGVYACNYNTSAEKVNLILENRGNIEIKNITMFVIYSDGALAEKSLNHSLPGGTSGLKSYSISGVKSDYSSITLRTECPGLSVSVSCNK